MTQIVMSEGVKPEVPAVVAEILAARGMAPEEMGAFLFPDYERDCHDPRLLLDMDKAVTRILQAVEAGERVVVYGDYDIDGITASAVLLETFAGLGLQASSYIPDRFEEGYGINQAALEALQMQGAQLVVSVDCGITSVDEAAWAKEHGLDLIITDHHSVPEVLPDAIAVVNPKRPGDPYPTKELAGVGVAFKLVQALQLAGGRPAVGQEKWLLDLVAMGTICDVVPLTGENRVLASFGLKVLRRTRRAGLRALAGVGGIEIDRISAYQVGFVLGPRMNAAGRLEHAARSLELVMQSTEGARASEIAFELDELNRRRRADQAVILQQADEMAAAYPEAPVLVLAHPEWSHGVVGIVASKLAEKWQRPVLLAQVLEGDKVKGSARSVPGYNMVEALRSQSHLLQKFGGHFFAAGYTLPLANVEQLRQGLGEYHARTMTDLATPVIETPDLAWDSMENVNEQLLEWLDLLEPHGSGNRPPVVAIDGVTVAAVRRVGAEKTHLSLRVRDRSGKQLGAIGFGMAERFTKLREGDTVGLRGAVSRNEFQGRVAVQMVLSDVIL
jgi:single-stranded-DNA-specific exonuclease